MINNCQKRNYHNWCPKTGPNVDSLTENYNEMTVHFICEDCKAEAEGVVYWDTEGGYGGE